MASIVDDLLNNLDNWPGATFSKRLRKILGRFLILGKLYESYLAKFL